MTLRDLALLLLLGALFGSAFLFVGLTAPAFGPLALMDLRVFLGAGVLILWSLAARQPLNFKRPWTDWLALGGLNAALPFAFLGFAQLHVPSSLAAIFVATAPLFTALVSAVWLKEALTLKKLAGLLLGLAGVAIISGGAALELNPTTLLALAVLLLSSLAYALGGLVAKLRFKGIPHLSVTSGNFMVAGLLLLPLAVTAPPRAFPSGETWLAFAALVLISTAVAWGLYFKALQRLGPTGISSVAYLIPMFGVLFGAVFLNEPIRPATLLGFGLILFSVALVTNLQLGAGRAAKMALQR